MLELVFVSSRKIKRMKLAELQSNAYYDMQAGVPAVIQADNDGSYLFRYNIEEWKESGEDGEEVQMGWKYREIRIWEQPSKAVLKKALIRSIVDETEEFSLLNSYNKHVIGIAADEEAVEKYKEFLLMTEEIDALLTQTFPDA